jgi:hypothetical protein
MESAALVRPSYNMEIPRSKKCSYDEGCLNVDGLCKMGGSLMPAGLRGNKIPSTGYSNGGCSAYPVYYINSVPYVSNNAVAGSDLKKLNNLYRNTTLNEDVYFSL